MANNLGGFFPDILPMTKDEATADSEACEEEASEASEFPIDRLQSGLYRTAWHVPSAFYAYLIGRKGDTRRRLEAETQSNISIPQRGAGATEDIVVTGQSVAKVRAGRLKVALLVEQARQKCSPTHFVSIPATAPNIQERFLQFQREVLEVCGGSLGVQEALFQKSAKLHLTVGVMALMDDSERRHAVQAFTRAVQESARDLPDGVLKLRLKGLHYFTDDPHSVRVLYAGLRACEPSDDFPRPHLPQQLQNLVDNIANLMIKDGVMRKNAGSVTLHMTVMNVSFLDRDEGEAPSQQPGVPHQARTEGFDASHILEKFGDYDFGDLEIKEVHLSLLHSEDPETGYYVTSARLPLAGLQLP
ncbi:activating signal cointegrator 1 complex subunit 1-like isoform X2 [Hyalella azteca]|uniref:Activating signal cointegrator 1 complex subunit 1-like isoform X2 n=1 Tax=Hyalella azteca TaxID=294128 RepID=A0A8B7P6K6_HYAAZ|nr:activating signal cointegrator 1 complex subunit 1-like isoform X2 [Hyalella azteca]